MLPTAAWRSSPEGPRLGPAAGGRRDADLAGPRPSEEPSPTRHRREGATRARLVAAPERATGFLLFTLACLVLAALGFALRDERYLTPARGIGYALGVTGLGLLALQLTYSARKRSRRLDAAGSLRTWFQVHMVLGVLGPLAILFHSGFRVGALNSAVALTAMLVVGASGFAGRFLYTRVHAGLFSERLKLQWLEQDVRLERGDLAWLLQDVGGLEELLRSFEATVLAAEAGPFASAARFAAVGLAARSTRRACLRAVRRAGPATVSPDEARRALNAYLGALVRVARFRAFEGLFALWHVLHVPLCLLLFGAAIVHVIAVHLY